MTTTMIRNFEGRRTLAEISPTGDPQVFPFTQDCSEALTLAKANPDNAHLQEIAQSVRDHRDGYRAGHTLNCQGNLFRGLCH